MERYTSTVCQMSFNIVFKPKKNGLRSSQMEFGKLMSVWWNVTCTVCVCLCSDDKALRFPLLLSLYFTPTDWGRGPSSCICPDVSTCRNRFFAKSIFDYCVQSISVDLLIPICVIPIELESTPAHSLGWLLTNWHQELSDHVAICSKSLLCHIIANFFSLHDWNLFFFCSKPC